MIFDTTVPIAAHEYPFPHFTADGLIRPEDLRRLNERLPSRTLFELALKSGPEHRKEYRMWILFVHRGHERLEVLRQLPEPWIELVEGILSDEFKRWLSNGTGVALSGLAMDAGLYLRDRGDFLGTDTGKLRKALQAAFYLNQEWPAHGGGCRELRLAKDGSLPPAKSMLPVGGRMDAFVPAENTWHSVSPVQGDGQLTRISMTLEYWRND